MSDREIREIIARFIYFYRRNDRRIWEKPYISIVIHEPIPFETIRESLHRLCRFYTVDSEIIEYD